MKTASPLTAVVRDAFEAPGRDVIRVTDDLLALCCEHGLSVDCRPERCTVRSLREGWEEIIERPFRSSVMRAISARFAVLCNEQHPHSVLPYGGRGTLSCGGTIVELSFANTPDELWLELRPAS